MLIAFGKKLFLFPLNVTDRFNQTGEMSVTFLMCWKPLTSVTLRPGTCSCPVPSGLILMSSFSPSLLSRSLWTKVTAATAVWSCSSQTECLFPMRVSLTSAPHCRFPRSWRSPCKTTCPCGPLSHWRGASEPAGWCQDSPPSPGNQDKKGGKIVIQGSAINSFIAVKCLVHGDAEVYTSMV